MTTKAPSSPAALTGTDGKDENAKLREIATSHGLSADGLVRLVSEARIQARDRRRRLSDARLEQLIRDMAGQS